MTEPADQLYHDNVPARSTALFWQSITSPQTRFGSLRLLVFPKAKIAVEREVICECDSDTVHKLCKRCLTAD